MVSCAVVAGFWYFDVAVTAYQAVAGLSPKDFPAGIAINNMIRQLGGAFGIALANNYVIRQYAQHRSDLMANTDVTNPLFMDRVNAIKAGLMTRSGDVALATQQAYKQIELTVDRQSYLLAYLDTFRVVSLFFIAIFPLIYFLKRKKPSPQELAKQAQAVAEAAH
jgi:DHA2 family multidrug resistance protein